MPYHNYLRRYQASQVEPQIPQYQKLKKKWNLLEKTETKEKEKNKEIKIHHRKQNQYKQNIIKSSSNCRVRAN